MRESLYPSTADSRRTFLPNLLEFNDRLVMQVSTNDTKAFLNQSSRALSLNAPVQELLARRRLNQFPRSLPTTLSLQDLQDS